MVVTTDEEALLYISANVRRLMDELRISQAELARMTGESEMRVSLLRRGKKLPTAGFLARIAEALSTTVDALLSSPPEKDSGKKTRRTA